MERIKGVNVLKAQIAALQLEIMYSMRVELQRIEWTVVLAASECKGFHPEMELTVYFCDGFQLGAELQAFQWLVH